MNTELKNRLLNFKFNQALSYLEGESRELKTLVRRLSDMYGNCGWIDGQAGEFIWAILGAIGVSDE